MTLGRVRHTWKSAAQLEMFGTLAIVQHTWKSMAQLEECGSLGTACHSLSSVRHFSKCADLLQVCDNFPILPHFPKCIACFKCAALFQVCRTFPSVLHSSKCAALFQVCRNNADIVPHSPVKNVGVWLDSNLSTVEHITKANSAAFFHLYNIRRIRKYLSRKNTETLIHAFVSSRTDYYNSLLYGVPNCHLHKLQWVENAAARLILEESKYFHVTPLPKSLH